MWDVLEIIHFMTHDSLADLSTKIFLQILYVNLSAIYSKLIQDMINGQFLSDSICFTP